VFFLFYLLAITVNIQCRFWALKSHWHIKWSWKWHEYHYIWEKYNANSHSLQSM